MDKGIAGPVSGASGDVHVMLRACPLFSAVDDETLHALAGATERHIYRKGQLIVWSREHDRWVLLVAHGCVHSYRMSTKGNEITLGHAKSGEVLGLMSDDEIPEHECLEAVDDCTEILHIPRAGFDRINAEYPTVLLSALWQVQQRLRIANDRIEDLGLYDIKTRLAHTLARLACRDEQRNVCATHRELASLVGTRQEEVSKALRQLRQAGLIRYETRRPGIVVPEPWRLRAYGLSA